MTNSSGTPSVRPGREPESASFETARVPSRGGPPPLLILGFLVLVGAFVAVGVGGQSSVALTRPPVALATPSSSPAAAATTPQRSARSSPAAPTPVPVMTSGPGPIQLQAQRFDTSMHVHGDVFIPRVTWVFMSVQDGDGGVAGWGSVSVPGAAGDARTNGPTLRFDIDVAIAAEFSGPLWLFANGYDDSGTRVASARVQIDPLIRSRELFEP
jgi:hypothetical protein